MTKSQEQAIGSAEDYLEYSHFSKKGLIEQLEYEDFSKKDARFAVEHVKVDWNKQAAGSAAQPGRKLSRTFRSGLSTLVSTNTTLCQVPSAGRPPSTGSIREGDTKAGST
jgi:Host cell surface-exposed lipoprotein